MNNRSTHQKPDLFTAWPQLTAWQRLHILFIAWLDLLKPVPLPIRLPVKTAIASFALLTIAPPASTSILIVFGSALALSLCTEW